jgi:hypothetical protein
MITPAIKKNQSVYHAGLKPAIEKEDSPLTGD